MTRLNSTRYNNESAFDNAHDSRDQPEFPWIWKLLDFVKVNLLTRPLRVTGLWDRGVRNALNLHIKPVEIRFSNLPESFNGIRILFLSDLHLGQSPELVTKIINKVRPLKYDLCLMGGDYRFHYRDSIEQCLDDLKKIMHFIDAPLGIYGVLGNHDSPNMVGPLRSMGIKMLMNESIALNRNGELLYLVGVEDSHFHKKHDLNKAFNTVPDKEFVLFVTHSPELYEEALEYKASFCLCGHTHNGQIRFPIIGALAKNCKVPKQFTNGVWKHFGLQGYTGSGVGTSLLPVRFLCPPEISLITFRKTSKPKSVN